MRQQCFVLLYAIDVNYDSPNIKKLVHVNFHGRRRVGRPRLRRDDNSRRDSLLLLNAGGWRMIEYNRNIWRRTLKRPEPDAGCRAFEEEEEEEEEEKKEEE